MNPSQPPPARSGVPEGSVSATHEQNAKMESEHYEVEEPLLSTPDTLVFREN